MPKMRPRSCTLAAAVSFAALLTSASMASAAPRTHVVAIEKMKFSAVPQNLRAGDTIVWINRDILRHTATGRDGSFNIDLAAGASGRMVIGKAGLIAFYCKFHPGMRGMLRVAR